MKKKSIYDRVQEIKADERKMLADALRKHGGSYTFPSDSSWQPIIAANLDCGPMDVRIEKAWLDEGGYIRFKAIDNEYGGDVDLDVYDVFAGHLEYVLDYMNAPDTEYGWLKVGAKCKWIDPGINDYDEKDREMMLNRIFEVVGIDGDIISIENEYSFAEVLAKELVSVD